jgi:hypothetical protein
VMNKQTLMATAAVAGLMFGCASAHATPIVTVTYTTGIATSPAPTGFAPTVTDDLASGFHITTSGLSEQNFLTTSPTGTCHSGTCMSSEQINFNFTFTDSLGGTATLTEDATYYAKYSGSSLGCDNNGNSQTDCIIWSGTNGSSSTLGSPSYVTDTVDLAINGVNDGSVVSLTFYNAHDWTITSEISGTYLYTPPQHQQVPEPASFVLFASGLAGLHFARRSLRRKPSKKGSA